MHLIEDGIKMNAHGCRISAKKDSSDTKQNMMPCTAIRREDISKPDI